MIEYTKPKQTVFTVSDIATGLRMSDETIRRKIQNGELNAFQVGNGSRKTLRILAQDLVQWLGSDVAKSVFGIGEGLAELERAFAVLEPKEREALIARATAFAKETAPKRTLTGRTVSKEEIAARFPKKR